MGVSYYEWERKNRHGLFNAMHLSISTVLNSLLPHKLQDPVVIAGVLNAQLAQRNKM